MLHATRGHVRFRGLYGARNGENHPFAAESRELLGELPRARAFVAYSRPTSSDRQGREYDFNGRLDASLLDRLGVPLDADFYVCEPNEFMSSFESGLRRRGGSSPRTYKEAFGPAEPMPPGISISLRPSPQQPLATPDNASGPMVSFTRSGLTVRGMPSVRLNRVLDFMNQNVTRDLRRGELAQVAGMSPNYFCHLFKQTMGLTAHQYVLRMRIDRAKTYLRDPKATLAMASAASGFADQSHLTKVFRRMVGVTPAQFRVSAEERVFDNEE